MKQYLTAANCVTTTDSDIIIHYHSFAMSRLEVINHDHYSIMIILNYADLIAFFCE